MSVHGQVKIETDVNVTSYLHDDVGRDVIEACASRVNISLRQVGLLDQALADHISVSDNDGLTGRPLTIIQSTVDCPSAHMTRSGFLYLSSGWQCPHSLVLDRRLWKCVSRM